MRLPLLMMIAVILISIGIDWLIYRRLHRYKLATRVHVGVAVVSYILIVSVISVVLLKVNDDILFRGIMWTLYSYFALFISKLIVALFVLVGKIPLIWNAREWKLFLGIGVAFGIGFFCVMMWGLVNRYRYQIVEQSIEFKNLPADFDGYRIVQFSDFHVGSYNDTTYVSKIVDVINKQNADLIVFTGDIVNRRTDELLPYIRPLGRLNAPDGVFSILGNHDYGDYSAWKSDNDKVENMQLMYRLQQNMGWRLLLNETKFIYKGNDSIALIGVENVGDPPFKVYGDLHKAYPEIADQVFKILLTHNPAHWTQSIADNDSINVDLSLSGHTHAMQIAFDICGYRFSPSVFRYDTWGGLYSDRDDRHKLYVNIGLGTVAIPARIGATPEITIITLRKSKNI